MPDFNHFAEIANLLEPFCSEVVTDTAQDIVDSYQSNAPRDTGFMSESAYIETSEQSTYGQGMAPTRKDAYLLPEVAKPDDKTTAYAAVGANYAVYPELGTRHQAPQPAFYPAVEQAASTFEDELGKLEDYLKQHVGGP